MWFDECAKLGYLRVFNPDLSMNLVVARSCKQLLPAVAVMVILGCDQVKDITSGGGTKDADPAQTSTGTISAQGSDATQEDASQGSESGDESSLKTWGEVLAEAGIEEEPEPDASSEDDTPTPDPTPTSDPNAWWDALPRLPRSVTWKPVSASSGGNLTIVLWGRGGGDKDYDWGSLVVKSDGSIPDTRPRKETWHDSERKDGPMLLFDRRGGDWAGRFPHIVYSSGGMQHAYKIINPSIKQGKAEY